MQRGLRLAAWASLLTACTLHFDRSKIDECEGPGCGSSAGCTGVADGEVCAEGRCHGGACCTGCWDGSQCLGGGEPAACGTAGGTCAICDPGKPMCVAGACVVESAVVVLDLAAANTCAVTASGELWCWGANRSFQVVAGDNSDKLPTQIGGGPWAQVATGATHYGFVLATKPAGDLWAWGWNAAGALGTGDMTDLVEPTEVSGPGWQQIAAGIDSSCGIRTDGTLHCWGVILGPSPAPISPEDDWSSVSVGGRHLCGIQTAQDGLASCWGDDSDGQLGPTGKQVGTSYRQVSAGGAHTCGIREDDSLWCWGKNDFGQLGPDVAAPMTSMPTRVPGAWVEVACGESHTCARTPELELFCWGDNADLQLGIGADTQPRATPTAVETSASDWVRVVAGEWHTCAVNLAGQVFCWGSGSNKQTGQDSDQDVPTPMLVLLSDP